jgi:DNA-binding NarL/FixJ family response regulator
VKRLRVVVVDDHDVVRRGVRALLESEKGWRVVGEAATGPEAIDLVGRLAPEVAVVDVSLPEMSGLEVTRRIRVASPGTEVLVLTVHDSEHVVREVMAAGARGYVLKSDAGRHLIAAVSAVAAHRTYVSERVAEIVVEGLASAAAGEPPPPDQALTAREREIVQMIAEGHTSRELAGVLGIRPKTVEAHRANVMRKLGLHTVAALVRYAIRHRMVDG